LPTTGASPVFLRSLTAVMLVCAPPRPTGLAGC